MEPSELFIYLVIVCSKEKKCQQVQEYWRKKYEELQDRRDEVPDTDSEVLYDHGCWLMDPQASTTQSLHPKKYG